MKLKLEDKLMVEDMVSLIKSNLTINKDFDKEYNEWVEKVVAFRKIKVNKEEEL